MGGRGRGIRLKCLKGKIFSACQVHIIVPAVSQPQTRFCWDLRPALALNFRMLHYLDSVHLGRDVGLSGEVG